jgi:hypothetical protein
MDSQVQNNRNPGLIKKHERLDTGSMAFAANAFQRVAQSITYNGGRADKLSVAEKGSHAVVEPVKEF